MHGFRDILVLSDSEIYGASDNCSWLNFVSHNNSLHTVMVNQFQIISERYFSPHPWTDYFSPHCSTGYFSPHPWTECFSPHRSTGYFSPHPWTECFSPQPWKEYFSPQSSKQVKETKRIIIILFPLRLW